MQNLTYQEQDNQPRQSYPKEPHSDMPQQDPAYQEQNNQPRQSYLSRPHSDRPQQDLTH
jgi:hypothetical protein